MQHHSEFYQLFSGFFWLVFPIGAGLIFMFGAWLHHKRAQTALEVMQTYAAQGKDAPPEVLALIQVRRRQVTPAERAQAMTLVGFILLAMAAAFTVLAATRGDPLRDLAGLYFIVAMFAGVAIAFFIAAWMARRDARAAEPR